MTLLTPDTGIMSTFWY